MVISGVCFAAMGVFAKVAARDFSSIEMVFYRSLLGMLIIIALAWKLRWPLRTPHLREHLWRSIFGVVSLAMFFFALTRLPLATAVSLNYTSSIFLAVLTTLLLKEKLHAPLALCVTVGFVGVLLLLRPTIDSAQLPAGLIGLLSGLGAAVAYISIRRLGQIGEPDWRVVYYFTLISTIATGAVAALTGFSPVRADNIWTLLGLGATATAGQWAMTRSYQTGRTLVVGALAYSTIVFSALAGWWFWDEALTPGAWLGMAIVIASGVLAVRLTPSKAHVVSTDKPA